MARDGRSHHLTAWSTTAQTFRSCAATNKRGGSEPNKESSKQQMMQQQKGGDVQGSKQQYSPGLAPQAFFGANLAICLHPLLLIAMYLRHIKRQGVCVIASPPGALAAIPQLCNPTTTQAPSSPRSRRSPGARSAWTACCTVTTLPAHAQGRRGSPRRGVSPLHG